MMRGHRRITTVLALGVASAGLILGLGGGVGRVGAAAAQRSNVLFGFNYPAGYPGFASAATAGANIDSVAPGSVLRLPVNWSELQPGCAVLTAPGVCVGGPLAPSWDFLDKVMSSLHSDGIRVIADVNDAPQWDWSATDCGVNCMNNALYNTSSIDMPPANTGEGLGYLSDFMKSFVSRYETLDPGEIASVEVWNEENSAAFWPTMAGPSPSRYGALLCAADRGVRSANGSVPVVLGGLSYLAGPSRAGYVDISDFLDGVYSSGATSCLTGVGLHSYPGEEPDRAGSPYLAALGQIRSTDSNHGLSEPIWITEFGYCVTGSSSCNAVSDQQQGYYIECGYQMALGMPDVAAFSVYSLYDGIGQSQLFGVYRAPSVPRPAVNVLTALFAKYGSAVPAASSCAQAYGWPSSGP